MHFCYLYHVKNAYMYIHVKEGYSMRLEHLHYITTINNFHSITRAADALYITQPALSRALGAVEEELGAQLFDRTKQGVSLTPVGERLLPYFKEIEEKMENVYQILAMEHAADIKGKFRISAGAILCNNILPKVIQTFTQNYPSIDVEIFEEYDTDSIHSIYNNKTDIGFLTISPHINDKILPLLDENKLSYRRLLHTSMIALIAADSPLANEDCITANLLSTQLLILNQKTKPFFTMDGLSNQKVFYYTSSSVRDVRIVVQRRFDLTFFVDTIPVFPNGGSALFDRIEPAGTAFLEQHLLCFFHIAVLCQNLTQIRCSKEAGV